MSGIIIVTGGAGFIGANLVRALNAQGRKNILVVDDMTQAEKVRNLADLAIYDYMDKEEFLRVVQAGGKAFGKVAAVFHQGACADTMGADGKYMLANNFEYSKAVYGFCARVGAQFIYASSASVYGGGEEFVEEARCEGAQNVYAWSKLLFDQFVRREYGEGKGAREKNGFQCVGLRYFNVYGPREQHKGRMASVAWHFFNQYREGGKVRLFEGSGGYGDGEQRRDFVAVEDVAAVNLFFLDHPRISGIYNVGTGRSESFNAVALAVINACQGRAGGEGGELDLDLEEAIAAGKIEYVAMPEALRGQYQSYTQADLGKLRKAGYGGEFADVARGVGGYVEGLLKEAESAKSTKSA